MCYNIISIGMKNIIPSLNLKIKIQTECCKNTKRYVSDLDTSKIVSAYYWFNNIYI